MATEPKKAAKAYREDYMTSGAEQFEMLTDFKPGAWVKGQPPKKPEQGSSITKDHQK